MPITVMRFEEMGVRKMRRRMTRSGATLLALVLLWAVPVAWAVAAESSASEFDDAWFWTDTDDLFSLDEGDLFGGGGLLTEVQEGQEGSLEEAFLVSDGVDVGGSYNLSAGADWLWSPDAGGPADGMSDQWVDLAGSLYFDTRPSRDFRAFAKVKGDVRLTDNPVEPNVKLHELFADFALGDTVFVRVGKQTVNWGVGYFFSPADIINIGRIDPEDPEAEREGPVAVRLNLPSGRNNYYAYAIVDGKPGDYRVAFAPKAEFVYGGSEVGLGLYYRADRAPRAMATLSTSLLGRVSLFGEAVVSKGSDKRFVREVPVTPTNPLGLESYEDPDSLRLHLTAGSHLTYSDPDGRFTVTAAGQYYYNGEGYDGEFLKANGLSMKVLGAQEPAILDAISNGRHSAALTISGTSRSFRDFNPSAFWLGSLSDGSGMVTLSLGYSGWKNVRPSISFTRMYGDIGSELAPGGDMTRIMVGVTIGGSR